jgi:hypothetical protein
MTPTIIQLSLVTWIPRDNKGNTEKNGFISPDFVKSFIFAVKQTFCDIKRQADQAEKTIVLHQDEIMAALKSIQGSTIFTTGQYMKTH